MEKITNIKQKDFSAGYWVEVQCSMCSQTRTFGGRTKKDISEQLKEEGWKDIDSDQYGLIGQYCGCDYKD